MFQMERLRGARQMLNFTTATSHSLKVQSYNLKMDKINFGRFFRLPRSFHGYKQQRHRLANGKTSRIVTSQVSAERPRQADLVPTPPFWFCFSAPVIIDLGRRESFFINKKSLILVINTTRFGWYICLFWNVLMLKHTNNTVITRFSNGANISLC